MGTQEKCAYYYCSILYCRLRIESIAMNSYSRNSFFEPKSKTVWSESIHQDIIYLKKEIGIIKQSNNDLKASNSELREDVAFLMDQNAKLMDQMEELSNMKSSRTSDLNSHSDRIDGQGILQQLSALMTNFNDYAVTDLAEINNLSVLSELSEMLKDIISNIAYIIKRNQNDLKETKDHLQESLNHLKGPETTTPAPVETTTASPGPKPIFEKMKPFNVTRGYKIGEIKSYHHNYEFSMEVKHGASSTGASVIF